MVYMISHYIRNHRSPYKKPMVSCMVTIGSYAWERMRTMMGEVDCEERNCNPMICLFVSVMWLLD